MTESHDEDMLKRVLATKPLSPQADARLRAAVEAQWRAAIEENAPPRRRWMGLAAAAALGALAVTVWVAHAPTPAVSIGSMSRLDERELSVSSGLFQHRSLRNGDPLRVGDQLTTKAPTLVTLDLGGTLRIGAGSSLRVTGTRELSLQRGLIYLDLPPGSGDSGPLRVTTSAGAVEHVGTEFEIFSDERAMRVRVREGRVRFLGKTNTILADAGTELVVTGGTTISQRPIDTYGREWSWTAALAPDFEIEGQSLLGFLKWVSRELGRPLDFADANARQVADRTILHGSVRHQAPMDAMSNVLATTSLTYEIRGDTLWVRSGATTAL